MILKSKRNIAREGIHVDQMYPVVQCKKNIKTGIMKYMIYDNCGSLSWETADNFYIESSLMKNYSEMIEEDSIYYTYKGFDKEFFYKFHLENEESISAMVQLENAMVNIISDELSIKDIMMNIHQIGFNNEDIEMQLKAFFRKASKEDIIKFSNELYDNVMDIDNYLLKVIVNSIVDYKEPEVENLLMKVYMSTFCSEDILNIINNYWN